MHDSYPFYNLYCTNMHCAASIYQNIKRLERPLNVDNLAGTHICHECGHPLVSSIDMEIGLITAEVGVILLSKTSA